jgi:meso-butanediol dehydrogenase / (S,S)-butanediol dehydrogenase / diacetyl reductase
MDQHVRRGATRFEGSVAVVTGAARGVGRAVATRLAEQGATVVIADRDAAPLAEVEAELGAIATVESRTLDVIDVDAVRAFFGETGERHGRIDVLVNCPAHANDTPFDAVSEQDYALDVDVTFKAPFFSIQAAVPALLRSEQGARVVSVASVNGLTAVGNEAYGGAKAALINLTKNLALRYGPAGLRFNIVAPGTLRTHAWDRRVEAEPHIFERVAKHYPLRRVGTADDVADACVFLASDEAAWITGAVLPVDGGLTAGHGELLETMFGPEFFAAERRAPLG